MHSTIFFVMAILATFTLAKPITTPHSLTKRSFRVDRKHRSKPSAHEAMRKAHVKYGWATTVWEEPMSNAFSAAPTNATDDGSEEGEVKAIPDPSHGAYISPVTIGGQQLNLDFDTGSSDLWVFSTALPPGEGAGHVLFNPEKSSSFVQYPGASWSTQYGDGSTASGNVGFDTVTIGGATVEKQCVELAETTRGFQDFTSSDGLLGLGFSSINTVRPQPQKTFWENILPQLDLPVFTADLDETATGSYEFGSIDSSKFTGELQYAPVQSSSGYWLVESRGNTIGGRTRACKACSPAVMDTGTSLMMVDTDLVVDYYSQVKRAAMDSSGLVSYPCSSPLPDFGVAIGNHIVTLKGSDLTYDRQGDFCLGGIQPSGMSGPGALQIYGDVFFKQYFTVFDGGNNQVGVAAKA